MTIENNWISTWRAFNRGVYDNHRMIALIFLVPSIIAQIYTEHYMVDQKGTFIKDVARLIGRFIGCLIVGGIIALIVKAAIYLIGLPLSLVLLAGTALLAIKW